MHDSYDVEQAEENLCDLQAASYVEKVKRDVYRTGRIPTDNDTQNAHTYIDRKIFKRVLKRSAAALYRENKSLFTKEESKAAALGFWQASIILATKNAKAMNKQYASLLAKQLYNAASMTAVIPKLDMETDGEKLFQREARKIGLTKKQTIVTFRTIRDRQMFGDLTR